MAYTRILIIAFCWLPALAAQDEFGALYPHPANFFEFNNIGGLVSADFDDDGNLDLAVPLLNEDTVAVLLGNGDGSHVQHATYPTPSPSFLALGDFDDDGNEDLAVTNFDDRSLSILMGLGDGTFVIGDTAGSLSGQGWRVAVGQFNEDDIQDVVMASPAGNLLFPGNGDGIFGAETAIPGASRSVVVGDFNEDGLDDFAEPTQVLLGDGTLGFTVGDDLIPFDSGLANQVATGDLDGDDDLDLVVADGDSLSVFLGDGDGSFVLEETHVSPEVTHVLILDVDGDLVPDLVTTCSGGVCLYGMGVLRGLGAGQFADAEQVDTGDFQVYTTVGGDFNHDGHQDVALAENTFSHSGVVLGRGDGTFEIPVPFASWNGINTIVDDLDLDGRDDVLTLQGHTILIALATGVGTFEFDEVSEDYADAFVVAEMNGDGVADLASIAGVSDSVSLFLGDGAGGFVHDATIPVVDPLLIETADLNGDRIDDVVVAFSNRLFVLLGQMESGFEVLPPVVIVGDPKDIALGPVDGDTHPDLVIAMAGGGLSARMGQGDGTFESAATVTAIDAPCGLALADLDGDSHRDLAVTTDSSPEVHILRGNSDGTFAPTLVLSGATDTRCGVSIDDLNGDATPDLLVPTLSIGSTLFSGNGDATFGSGHGVLSGRDVASGDFDLDGRIDLVTGIGTLLLNQSGPDTFTFLPDGVTLVWPSAIGAQSYTVYRGLLAELVDADDNGLPDGGYGNCISTLDDDDRDTFLVDAELPPAGGSGFFYLVGIVDAGGEHGLGTTSTGLPRVPQGSCP